MICTMLLNMCVVGLVETAPDVYKLELFDPTLNVREYVIIRAEPDKK